MITWTKPGDESYTSAGLSVTISRVSFEVTDQAGY